MKKSLKEGGGRVREPGHGVFLAPVSLSLSNEQEEEEGRRGSGTLDGGGTRRVTMAFSCFFLFCFSPLNKHKLRCAHTHTQTQSK